MVGKKSKRSANHGAIMTGADMTIQAIADEGIDTIFGYSGGAILPTYDAIFRYNANNPKNKSNSSCPQMNRAPDSWRQAMPVLPARLACPL